MFKVQCPECNEIREVRAKKPWMTGSEPYSKTCKACCQTGKEKSPETIQKLSDAAKAQQTPETLEAKSKFMKEHPELWRENLVPGAGGGWNGGIPMSAETREKISKGVREAKKKS